MIQRAFLLFEQSGVFKNAFIEHGVPAFDYDIENNFAQTDCVVDLFDEIECAFDGFPSLFDEISTDDLVFAFFSLHFFCEASSLAHRFAYNNYRSMSFRDKTKAIIERNGKRSKHFSLLAKLFAIAVDRGLSLIVENPWNNDGFLKSTHALMPPSFIDYDRSLHGDFFKKPTAYWFVNFSMKKPMDVYVPLFRRKIHFTGSWSQGGDKKRKMLRSLISQDYADNFVRNVVLGKPILQKDKNK